MSNNEQEGIGWEKVNARFLSRVQTNYNKVCISLIRYKLLFNGNKRKPGAYSVTLQDAMCREPVPLRVIFAEADKMKNFWLGCSVNQNLENCLTHFFYLFYVKNA